MTFLLSAVAHLGLFVLRATVIAGGATLFLRTSLARARRVYRRDWSSGQLGRELRAAVRVLCFDACAIALARTGGAIHFAEDSAGNVAFTFTLFFVWYEVWFYATHRAMHGKALYFVHAQHHVAKVTHPITSLSFDLLERAVLQAGAIGFAILASRVAPVSLAGMAAYFVTNYALNVLGHLNVELLPARYGKSRLAAVFISTSFHAMHHARYTGHYGLFTTVLDRLFGTYWHDYPEVHERAATGRGLTALGERALPGELLDVLRPGEHVGLGEPGLRQHVQPGAAPGHPAHRRAP